MFAASSSCTALDTTLGTMPLPIVRFLLCCRDTFLMRLVSLLGRTFPFPHSREGYCRLPMVESHGRILQPIRQPNRYRTCRLEILYQVRDQSNLSSILLLINHDSYCVFLGLEVIFVYFLFPETSNKSLEELAFCTYSPPLAAWT